MTYLAKPKLLRADAPRNAVGYTRRDYEGAISTLCAGCGHDSISAAVVQACFDLDIEPHRSPSCPASAARRRRRTISSAPPTASTPPTAACRRC
jgi:pyruvate/2-oxoacid:ferredoxin oxidoreductase beta subunit